LSFVFTLNLLEIATERRNRLFQLFHGILVPLIHGCLNFCSISSQLVLSRLFLGAQLTLCKLEVVYFNSSRLFVLFSILLKLIKLILLILQRLVQVLDSTGASFNLLLHSVALLKRCRQSRHPKWAHLGERSFEWGNVALSISL